MNDSVGRVDVDCFLVRRLFGIRSIDENTYVSRLTGTNERIFLLIPISDVVTTSPAYSGIWLRVKRSKKRDRASIMRTSETANNKFVATATLVVDYFLLSCCAGYCDNYLSTHCYFDYYCSIRKTNIVE
jgi:hypothetical protein